VHAFLDGLGPCSAAEAGAAVADQLGVILHRDASSGPGGYASVLAAGPIPIRSTTARPPAHRRNPCR
jgi:hypothetical protein